MSFCLVCPNTSFVAEPCEGTGKTSEDECDVFFFARLGAGEGSLMAHG